MASKFTATQVVNERPRPRVLVFTGTDSIDFSWVESRAETFKMVGSLNSVDLTEWDLVVTDQTTINRPSSPWENYGQVLPDQMYTFRVMNLNTTRSHVFDFPENSDGSARQPHLEWTIGVAGHRSRRVDNLPEVLQDLVQQALLPAIEARQSQEGIVPQDDAKLVPTMTEFRPFLVGPGDLVFAASYKRKSGRHWVVPSDVPDLGAWLDCAINEWHREKPDLFPSGAAWQLSPDWMTPEELTTNTTIEDAKRELREREAELREQMAVASDSLDGLRAAGDASSRRLLTAQDDELQDEVLVALRTLGFQVEDMDLIWEPRSRREDYRIRDDDAPGWIALGDATGTTRGAKAGKLIALQTHLTKFLMEEERPSSPPVLWLVINHLIQRDPNSRGPLFTDGDVAVLKAASALAIDTAALFVIVRACRDDEARSRRAREWMRSRLGQLTLTDASGWVAALSE